MTKIARHDTGSVEDWQISYDSIAASLNSLLENLPQMPLAVGQLITLSWQRAALASLRATAAQDEICESLRLGAASAAATFLAAQWDNGQVEATLGGRELTFAATGATSLASPDAWLMGFSLALVVHDQAALELLCDEAAIEASERSSTQVDAFWAPLQRGLAALWLQDTEAWQHFATETERLLQPEAISIASTEYLQALIWPLFKATQALASGDQTAWQRALEAALVAHHGYFERGDHRYDKGGFLAFYLLGLAALAKDRGLQSDIESEYLPDALLKGTCNVTEAVAPEFHFDQPRSVAEAHLLMEVRSCVPNLVDHQLVEIGGELISLYECPASDEHPLRRFAFKLPTQEPDSSRQIGGDQPSTLIDAGEFLWLADQEAQQVPASTQGLSPEALQQRNPDLQKALACLDEVLKFIPANSEEVPNSAFWTAFGRQLREEELGRFSRARLEAIRQAWQTLLVEPAATPELDARSRTLLALEAIKTQVRPMLELLPSLSPAELAQQLYPRPDDYGKVFDQIDLAWLSNQYAVMMNRISSTVPTRTHSTTREVAT
ncbi:MAG: immunity 49 family protein [Caldilineaceae bacterium]